MKRIILFLLFWIMPMNLLADDACTNPEEYTIDQRCYVTDEQKKQTPYNAVVAVVLKSGLFCTGTIVKQNGKLWIYTAKHCTDQNGDGVSDKKLTVQLQDGTRFDVYLAKKGDYNIKKDSGFDGDWAIYEIRDNDTLPFVLRAVRSVNSAPYYEGRVVGYGSLRIMSDIEIERFRALYMLWLSSEGLNPGYETGVYYDGGIEFYDNYVQRFYIQSDFYLTGDNSKLKVSHCSYSGTNEDMCQIWGGNSGGPVFDSNDNIIGIITRGILTIGSEDHARFGGDDSSIDVSETLH